MFCQFFIFCCLFKFTLVVDNPDQVHGSAALGGPQRGLIVARVLLRGGGQLGMGAHLWRRFVDKRRYEVHDIAANLRKKQLEGMATTAETIRPYSRRKKADLLRTIISLGRCSLLELQTGTERWESCVSRNEKKLKDKLVRRWNQACWSWGIGAWITGETLESLANIPGCARGIREVGVVM